MSRWFRHYAGMMRDEKLVGAAVKSKQSVERVIWVWGAILESAAEINDGGRYDFDCGEAAYFLRCSEDELVAVMSALEGMGRLHKGVVVRWSDRQFESDLSTGRVKRHREKQHSDNLPERESVACDAGNASETLQDRFVTPPETETETETEKVEKNNLTVVPKEIAEAFAAYNSMAERVGLSRATKLSPQRQSKLKARLRDAGGIAGWGAALERVAASAYCRGEVNGFKADLGFLLQDESFTRLMEGKYDDRKPVATTPAHHKPGSTHAAISNVRSVLARKLAEAERGSGGDREDTETLPGLRQGVG